MCLSRPDTDEDQASPGAAQIALSEPDMSRDRDGLTLLELVRLAAVMERTRGRPEIAVALIDGPVSRGVTAIPAGRIRETPGAPTSLCATPAGAVCKHGTLVASILAADRGAGAPGICPGCAFMARPIFTDTPVDDYTMPAAAPKALAVAIADCMNAGARILNLSLAVVQASAAEERELVLSLDDAAARGVLVIAAAGNHGTVGSNAITRHPWVVPVVACDLGGRTLGISNLGSSIGRRGLSAPGEGVIGLDPEGKRVTAVGTSIAAPFVTGAAALLWSEFPKASAAAIKLALTRGRGSARRSIIPPLLDAWSAYEVMYESR
jgi:subtilisin family serine protease